MSVNVGEKAPDFEALDTKLKSRKFVDIYLFRIFP